VPRYLSLALPGAALTATLAAARFVRADLWKPLSLLLGFGALLFLGQWRDLWPRHHNSDWRAAASAVNQLASDPATPVVVPSPFLEAVPPLWSPGYPLPGFLYAHLAVYPIRGRVQLFPFTNSPAAAAHAAALSSGALSHSGRFLIYGWEPQVHYWRDWFGGRAELAGWRQRILGPFADVAVVVFEKP